MSIKNNLFIFPQGIGDLAIPLKFFLIDFINRKDLKNDFIVQYSSHKNIINKYNKSRSKFFKSKIFYSLDLKKIIQIRKNSYECVYIEPNINIFKAILISLLIKSKKKIYKRFFMYKFFFNESPFYERKNRLQYFLKIKKKAKQNLLVFKSNKKKISKILGIAPGTGFLEKHRRWRPESFISIINNIKHQFDEIYIFGNEKKLTKFISDNINFKNKIINYPDINRSIDELRNIDYLISNDNGIANFAAIFGVKTHIICGPSLPYSILNMDNVNIIKKNIGCSPCYDKKRFGCGNPICLSELKPDSVLKKLY